MGCMSMAWLMMRRLVRTVHGSLSAVDCYATELPKVRRGQYPNDQCDCMTAAEAGGTTQMSLP